MKILKAEVEWHFGYGNTPGFKVLVDQIPDLDDLRYRCVDGKSYYAELDGYVSFFAYEGPGEGFGGRVFPITMEDGTKKDLVGPWSSNSMWMNQVGYGPCVEVSMTADPKVWEKGHTFFRAAVRVDFLLPAIEEGLFDDARFSPMRTKLVVDNDDHYYPAIAALVKGYDGRETWQPFLKSAGEKYCCIVDADSLRLRTESAEKRRKVFGVPKDRPVDQILCTPEQLRRYERNVLNPDAQRFA